MLLSIAITWSGRMTYPFSTGHQARCSSRKRSSHVSLSSISFAISVVSMAWSSENRAFVVRTVAACELLRCGFTIIGLRVTKYSHLKIFCLYIIG